MPATKPAPEALEVMRGSPYNFPDTRWAAYENHALDSATCGELRFLAVGPRNTYHEAPNCYPDSALGIGWKFLHIGWVDLERGTIEADPQRPAAASPLTA